MPTEEQLQAVIDDVRRQSERWGFPTYPNRKREKKNKKVNNIVENKSAAN